MATCPKCGVKISPFDWRANCANCGVNIMYYGLEERLEADAQKAEKEFEKMDNLIIGVKRSVIGSKLTLARLIAGFLSIGLLCIPMITIGVALPFVNINASYGLVQVVTGVMSLMDWIDFDGIIALMGSEMAFPVIFLALGTVMLAISAVVSLVAVIIYILPHPEKGFKRNVVLRIIVMASFVVSIICFFVAQAWGNGINMNVLTGGIHVGGFIYLLAEAALLYIEFYIKKHGIPDEPLQLGKKKKNVSDESSAAESAEQQAKAEEVTATSK